MDKRPKRRKSKDNPYILSCNNELNIYIISFEDSNNVLQNISVSKEIFDVFNEFELKDLSQLNEYDNHIEHFNLEEIQLYNRLKNRPKGLEEEVFDRILLNNVFEEISKLPYHQKNRFIKYYLNGMTFEQIAKQENCTKRAVKFSVDIAFEKISKKFQK